MDDYKFGAIFFMICVMLAELHSITGSIWAGLTALAAFAWGFDLMFLPIIKNWLGKRKKLKRHVREGI